MNEEERLKVRCQSKNDQIMAYLYDNRDRLKCAVDKMFYNEELNDGDKRLIMASVYCQISDLILKKEEE